MKKRFVIVFIMVLCLLTFVGCLGNEAEKVLAMGVRQKPDVVNYEVGMPLDVTGGKVAVVYDNEKTSDPYTARSLQGQPLLAKHSRSVLKQSSA